MTNTPNAGAAGTPEQSVGASANALLRIEVGGPGSKPYKSIDGLVWDNIPKFAVLTGVNGSGKTQLLELLAYKLSNTKPPPQMEMADTKVVASEVFGANTVVYIPGTNILSQANVGIEQIRQIPGQLLRQFNQQGGQAQDIGQASKYAWLTQWIRENQLAGKAEHEIVAQMPNDLSFMLDEANVINGLSHIFVAHNLKVAQTLVRERSRGEVDSKLERAPWELLNDALAAADFPYRVVSPVETDLHLHYSVRFRKVGTNTDILPDALSSGEQAIVKLFAWLFHTKNYRRVPKLYLLDEPDAHLHPSLTRQFMTVLKDVLVDQYDIRVMLSTHSPSTVALAPPGSVFEMFRTAPRILPSPSIAHTVGLLTAGLLVVSRDTRFVFVEDEDDVEFYSTVWDILTDKGPSKVPNGLEPSPSIVFLPASLGAGAAKIAGGNSVVMKYVAKFDQAPLDAFVRGLIDMDVGNVATSRVQVIGRHSIENYLLDPLIVYALLNEDGRAPGIPGINIPQGAEHLLRDRPQAELQSIVDGITAAVEARLTGLSAAEKGKQSVSFTNGISLQYPNWMINRRGHDLVPMFQYAFGGPNVVKPPSLLKQVRRVRLIPGELAAVMRNLQQQAVATAAPPSGIAQRPPAAQPAGGGATP
jgi:energy-coupling factor transporter ATP-binding protein EcfA2